MSKSDTNVNGFVLMLDDADTIVRKFKRAVTDSDGCVRAAGDKPGVTNLMSIYSVFTGRDYAAIEKEFAGRGLRRVQAGRGRGGERMLSPPSRPNTNASWRTRLIWTACSPRGGGGARRARHCGPHSDKSLQKVGFCKFNRILAYISLQIVKIFFFIPHIDRFCKILYSNINDIRREGYPPEKGEN